MSNHFLTKYLIKEDTKINPNFRKLLIKHDEELLFATLIRKYYSSDIGIEQLSSNEIGRIFWGELKDGGKVLTAKCLTCHNPLGFGGWKYGWITRFCSTSCQMKHDTQQIIRKNDSLARFGTPTYMHNSKGQLAVAATKMTPEYQEKFKNIIKKVWIDKGDKIVSKMLESRKCNAKPYWKNRFSNKIQNLKNSGFEIIEENASGRPIKIKHACGFVQGYGRWANKDTYLCSACYPRRHTQQISIFKELEDALGIKIQTQVSIGQFRVDGKIGNLIIEYSGMFWHSAAALNAGLATKQYDPNYHFERTRYLREQGYQVFEFSDVEWLNSKQIILQKIKVLLGVAHKIHARKCHIGEVDHNTARKFMMEHHINKSVPFGFAVGLYHGDTLVACATFGASRYERGYLELLRFASIGVVVGGLSRIAKYVHITKKSAILSYSDNSWGSGHGYLAAGFRLVTDAIVGYAYYDKKNHCKISRISMRKANYEKTFGIAWDNLLSEEENARNVECYIIHDSGKKKWVYEAKLINK